MQKKNGFKIFLGVMVLFIGCLFLFSNVYAAGGDPVDESGKGGDPVDVSSPSPSSQENSLANDKSAGSTELLNPVSNYNTVEEIMGLFAKAILYVLGSVALLVLVYSGVKLVLSRGNADTVKSSSNALIWATIGLLVAFGSYVILKQALTFMTGF